MQGAPLGVQVLSSHYPFIYLASGNKDDHTGVGGRELFMRGPAPSSWGELPRIQNPTALRWALCRQDRVGVGVSLIMGLVLANNDSASCDERADRAGDTNVRSTDRSPALCGR